MRQVGVTGDTKSTLFQSRVTVGAESVTQCGLPEEERSPVGGEVIGQMRQIGGVRMGGYY